MCNPNSWSMLTLWHNKSHCLWHVRSGTAPCWLQLPLKPPDPETRDPSLFRFTKKEQRNSWETECLWMLLCRLLILHWAHETHTTREALGRSGQVCGYLFSLSFIYHKLCVRSCFWGKSNSFLLISWCAVCFDLCFFSKWKSNWSRCVLEIAVTSKFNKTSEGKKLDFWVFVKFINRCMILSDSLEWRAAHFLSLMCQEIWSTILHILLTLQILVLFICK